MAVGNFTLYSEAIEAMAAGGLGSLASGPVAAVLLAATHTPDADAHGTWADLSADELTGGDYAQVPVTLGATPLVDIPGGVRFTTNTVTFVNPGTIADAKYFVLVMGTAGSLTGTERLIGFVDLDDASASATVASLNAEFSVQTPASGWFEITRQ